MGRDRQVLCFGLVTVTRNYHQCALMGVARALAPGQYLYEEGATALRFTFITDEEISLELLGEGYKKGHCGMHGVIETATYMPAASAS